MDGNYGNGFNQDSYNQEGGYSQNGYAQGNYTEGGYGDNGYNGSYGNNADMKKSFGDSVPVNGAQNDNPAKTSLGMGVLSLVGSICCLLLLFLLNRIVYIMVAFPVISVMGILLAIKSIKIEGGNPKAIFGLILNIVGFFPGLLCTLLFILDMVACFIPS